MFGLPEVTVVGTLTADPELKFLASGVPVTTFTVAANERRYDQTTGEWVDRGATFLRCQLWRQPAENVAESLRKGMRVIATGALRQRSFTDREGVERIVYELDVNEIGPSLRWATATVTKPARNGQAAAESTAVPAAPGAGEAAAAAVDEPPF